LLRHKCDINARNNFGQDAVILSCLKKDTESLKILLKNGADANTKDLLGLSPMDYSVEQGIKLFFPK